MPSARGTTFGGDLKLISQKSWQNGTRSSTDPIIRTWFASAVVRFVSELLTAHDFSARPFGSDVVGRDQAGLPASQFFLPRILIDESHEGRLIHLATSDLNAIPAVAFQGIERSCISCFVHPKNEPDVTGAFQFSGIVFVEHDKRVPRDRGVTRFVHCPTFGLRLLPRRQHVSHRFAKSMFAEGAMHTPTPEKTAPTIGR